MAHAIHWPDVAGDFDLRLALLRLAVREEASRTASVIETHMSFVFLTDRHAYKLKKPVRYDYLDFSTLAARRQSCEDEVRLNRRLAPDVYLGVVALTADAAGELRFDGDGTVLDWLVKMRRLPAEQMMDRAIAAGTLTKDDVRAVAAFLSRFYLTCKPIALDSESYRRRFAQDIEDNLRALTNPEFGLAAAPVRAACAAQSAFLARCPGHFDRRVLAGRIVEGHGDLRPEHICLKPALAIIDCLEFSRELRLLDTADEFAFLALECERLGAAWAAEELFATHAAISGDRPEAALVHFYQSYRACLRAKIAIWHLNEARFRQSPRWTRRAVRYLALANEHAGFLGSAPALTSAAIPQSIRHHECS